MRQYNTSGIAEVPLIAIRGFSDIAGKPLIAIRTFSGIAGKPLIAIRASPELPASY